METPTCPGCRERDARIVALEQRVAELEAQLREVMARLGNNSSNSGIPPSANPLDAPKPVKKRKSGRQRGGQPGHPPHLKQLLPAERIDKVVTYVPQCCGQCHATLPASPAPGDPEPKRFQSIELRPIVTTVTEFQGHARTCGGCGHVTWATIPRAVLAHSVGPRLTATLSYFRGCQGMSKRAVEEVAAAIFHAPLALGTVVNLEQEMSAALAGAHAEALAAVQQAAVKHTDETSWKLVGKLCWLWAAATTGVAAFVIHAKRSALGLAALLGTELQGILCTDRWSVYDQVPPKRRQVCWAHLKRDFQKIIDRGGASVFVGHRGRKLVRKVFAAWHAFQAKQATREQLQAQLSAVEKQLNRLLLEGAILGEDKKVAAFCENLLALEPALWTFAHTEGVEPTNNFVERLLRRAVLWRKRSFGCASQGGCRFVERILTVVQTRRLQGQNVLDYLHDALHAHRTGQPCPKLLPAE
jgi:transposase